MANNRNTTNYFPHDANARNDERVLRLRMRHGAAGYGVYFMLLERMREEADYTSTDDYEVIAYDLHEDPELVRSVIEDFGLFAFTEADGTARRILSPAFLRRMERVEEVSRKRSEAAGNRWRGADSGVYAPKTAAGDANGMQMQSNCNANAEQKQSNKSKVNKSKVKERKENKIKEDDDERKKSARGAEGPPSSPSSGVFNFSGGKGFAPAGEAEWLLSVARQTDIAPGEMAGLLEAFGEHCRARGKVHESEEDRRCHFLNLLLRPGGRERLEEIRRKRGRAAARERREAEEAAERNRRAAEEKDPTRGMKPNELIRWHGYDPAHVTFLQATDPDWRRANPPRQGVTSD